MRKVTLYNMVEKDKIKDFKHELPIVEKRFFASFRGALSDLVYRENAYAKDWIRVVYKESLESVKYPNWKIDYNSPLAYALIAKHKNKINETIKNNNGNCFDELPREIEKVVQERGEDEKVEVLGIEIKEYLTLYYKHLGVVSATKPSKAQEKTDVAEKLIEWMMTQDTVFREEYNNVLQKMVLKEPIELEISSGNVIVINPAENPVIAINPSHDFKWTHATLVKGKDLPSFGEVQPFMREDLRNNRVFNLLTTSEARQQVGWKFALTPKSEALKIKKEKLMAKSEKRKTTFIQRVLRRIGKKQRTR